MQRQSGVETHMRKDGDQLSVYTAVPIMPYHLNSLASVAMIDGLTAAPEQEGEDMPDLPPNLEYVGFTLRRRDVLSASAE